MARGLLCTATKSRREKLQFFYKIYETSFHVGIHTSNEILLLNLYLKCPRKLIIISLSVIFSRETLQKNFNLGMST